MIFASHFLPGIFENAHKGQIDKKHPLYGSWVEESLFYQALLNYGTFDEYHLFAEQENFASIENSLSAYVGSRKNIKVIDIGRLPDCLSHNAYTVFHCETDIYRFSYLRSKYAKRNFPLFKLTHGISNNFLLFEEFLRNMLADLYPFDSTICSSTMQRDALRNIYAHISRALLHDNGIKVSYKGRFDVLPLGINSLDYDQIKQAAARRYLHIHKDRTVILYFGRFAAHNKMDIEPLLWAFKELLKGQPNTLLLLAGKDTGQYGREVKRLASAMGLSGVVKVHCNPSAEEKLFFYAASDIFVSFSDSLSESFGLTVLEAMASGLPVVVSDWDGYRDLVEQGKQGFLVPTYWARNNARGADSHFRLTDAWQREHLYRAQSVCVDVQKIIEYLDVLINSKALRKKCGARGRAAVIKNYEWKTLIRRYEKLWRNLSKEAQAYSPRHQRQWAFISRYFDFFQNYPTQWIDKNTCLSITKRGEEFLRKKIPPFIPKELKGNILPQVLFLVLIFLSDKKSISVKKLGEEVIAQRKDILFDDLFYQLMWMLKKGLLQLER